MCPSEAARCRLLLLVILLNLSVATAFNLDTSSPYVKEGPSGSYFGFSVVHKRWDGVPENLSNRIIVGAPKADGSGKGMIGHWETGAIFGCGMTTQCMELGYAESNLLSFKENRTGMWLGVSVAASPGGDGSIIACGHRDTFMTGSSGAIAAIGLCFKYPKDKVETSEQDIPDVLLPCSEQRITEEDTFYGLCQAGSSLATEGEELLIGAPGSVTWSGGFKWEDNSASYNVFVQELIARKYSYLGSSVGLAENLLGDKSKTAISGAPKANDVGQVLVFQRAIFQSQDSALVKLTLSGDQFGAAFGHAVAAVDVKQNNNNPSLVVSAPYYHGRNVGGAIFIYDNNGSGIRNDSVRKIMSRTMTDRECSDLRCEDAAFGYSIASVGDINGDTYNDLAVGAPYEGNGSVYIFLGGEKGLSNNYSQRISADDFPGSPRGFGVSVAGVSSPDNPEGYDGIVVGAYKSDRVYVLRSRPIVHIQASIKADITDVDPSALTCSGRPGVNMPCVRFSVCFNLSSNRQLGDVFLTYKLTGDAVEARPARRRVQFSVSSDASELSNRTHARVGGPEQCVQHLAFIRDVRDLLKPITVTMDYDLSTERPSATAGASLLSYPIADVTTPRSAKLDFNFKKSCVTAGCITSLSLALHFDHPQIVPDDNTSLTTFVFSSGEVDYVPLTIVVAVDNSATTSSAYEPLVYVDIPPQLQYDSYTSDVQTVSCSANVTQVTCLLPKIMPKGLVVKFSIKMKVLALGSLPSTIMATVNASNPDSFPADNVRKISIRQVIKTDLAIFGQAEGGQVFFNGSTKGAKAIQYLNEIGDFVQHTYTITNHGPGDVERVTLLAEWPYETTKGRYLLYMEREPQLKSNDGSVVKCNFDARKVNPEGYLAKPPGSQSSSSSASTAASARGRRDASARPSAATVLDGSGQNSIREVRLDCRQGTAMCFSITCEIGFFKKKSTYVLTLPARLWGSTLWDEGHRHNVDFVYIISHASLYIDPTLNVEQPTNNDAALASTIAQPALEPLIVVQVDWWIYAVAGGAGLLLLVIIIIIFWKCGFFQRHRPMLHEGKVEKKKGEQPDYKYEAVPTTDKAQ